MEQSIQREVVVGRSCGGSSGVGASRSSHRRRPGGHRYDAVGGMKDMDTIVVVGIIVVVVVGLRPGSGGSELLRRPIPFALLLGDDGIDGHTTHGTPHGPIQCAARYRPSTGKCPSGPQYSTQQSGRRYVRGRVAGWRRWDMVVVVFVVIVIAGDMRVRTSVQEGRHYERVGAGGVGGPDCATTLLLVVNVGTTRLAVCIAPTVQTSLTYGLKVRIEQSAAGTSPCGVVVIVVAIHEVNDVVPPGGCHRTVVHQVDNVRGRRHRCNGGGRCLPPALPTGGRVRRRHPVHTRISAERRSGGSSNNSSGGSGRRVTCGSCSPICAASKRRVQCPRPS